MQAYFGGKELAPSQTLNAHGRPWTRINNVQKVVSGYFSAGLALSLNFGAYVISAMFQSWNGLAVQPIGAGP